MAKSALTLYLKNTKLVHQALCITKGGRIKINTGEHQQPLPAITKAIGKGKNIEIEKQKSSLFSPFNIARGCFSVVGGVFQFSPMLIKIISKFLLQVKRRDFCKPKICLLQPTESTPVTQTNLPTKYPLKQLTLLFGTQLLNVSKQS